MVCFWMASGSTAFRWVWTCKMTRSQCGKLAYRRRDRTVAGRHGLESERRGGISWPRYSSWPDMQPLQRFPIPHRARRHARGVCRRCWLRMQIYRWTGRTFRCRRLTQLVWQRFIPSADSAHSVVIGELRSPTVSRLSCAWQMIASGADWASSSPDQTANLA